VPPSGSAFHASTDLTAGPHGAAEALADIVAGLAALCADAADRGVGLMHWTTARELTKKARFLPERSTDLWRMCLTRRDAPA